MKKFKTKSTKKKIISGLVGVAFLGIGTVSSVASSGFFAGWYGDVMREKVTVEETNVENDNLGYCSEEIYTTEPLSGNVILMEGTSAKASYSYDWTIPSKTTYQSMQGYYKAVGSKITTTTLAEPTNHTVYVGIIQPDSSRRYVSGSGTFSHSFDIKQSGTHYVYVENPGSGTVEVFLGLKY